ncbi:MAG: iron-containing alcohol dehydrogenase [Eubacterium ramulus]
MEKNREARHQMALAALKTIHCINNSSVTLVHGLSRPIGALFHVAYCTFNAMVLKACFSFALEVDV